MRMLLYFDKPRQPTGNETAIYPIYELDLQGLADAGMVSWGLSGQVTNAVNECYHVSGSVNNVAVNQYLSTNIPHQQWQDGSILQARISKYVLNENNVYVPDPEYYDFEEIPIGQQPDDWGTASNYVRYVVSSNATIDGQTVTYRAYYNVRKSANWHSDRQYFRDKNRSMIRHFYTENGYSFGVYQGADCDGGSACGPVFNAAGDSQYSDNFSNPSPDYYIWCNPSENMLYVGGNNIRVLSPWWSRTDTAADKGKMIAGREISAATFFIFVHGVYNDRDYYGTLCIYPDDFSDGASFKAIAFSLFTSEFWGDSIISGGGGENNWGPISIPGGGSGSFEISKQDSRGDPDGHAVADRAGDIRSALDPFFTGSNGLKLHQLLSAAIPDIYALLYADTSGAFLRRYEQSMYNPLSAIVSVHLLPEKLVHLTGSSSDLTASGYNISQNLPTPQTFPIVSSIGSYPKKDGSTYGTGLDSFDFEAYFDAFPDFAPYTQVRLHLPYCGVIDIDTDAVMHGKLQVSYICDAISGNVAAYVWCQDKDGRSTYSYVATGNAALSLPMFAAQQDGSSVGKLGLSLVGIGLGAATGNAAGIAGGIAGAAGAVVDAATAHRTTQITGQYSGNVGALTDTVCWLEITRPVWAEPDNYQLLHGETSQLGGTIAAYQDGIPYTGFLQVQQIDADGINATRSEIDEIEQLLQAGIYVNDPNA